jgi:transcriptional regulator with XRE-family HTH domain
MKNTTQNPAESLIVIGKRLRAIRNSLNIHEDVAAKSLGISTSRLEGIERGEKNYNLTLLVQMCDYYNVSVLDVVD